MAFKDVVQPKTYEERCSLARRTRSELKLTSLVLVDTMDDVSRALFGDLPSPALVIGPEGVVHVKLPWAEPDVLSVRLTRQLARKRTPKNAATPPSLGNALRLVWNKQTDEGRATLEKLLPTLKSDEERARCLEGLAVCHQRDGDKARSRVLLRDAATAAGRAFSRQPHLLTSFLAGLLEHAPGPKLGESILAEIIRHDASLAAWIAAARKRLR